jgi:hypothetical protein
VAHYYAIRYTLQSCIVCITVRWTVDGTTKEDPPVFTIHTANLVVHDPHSHWSRTAITYTESSVYVMFKKFLTGPVYVALGNHDSPPEKTDAPHWLPGSLGEQQSWHYRLVEGISLVRCKECDIS